MEQLDEAEVEEMEAESGDGESSDEHVDRAKVRCLALLLLLEFFFSHSTMV